MKTIMITGANRGIGLEMVTQYMTAGWRVIACCRDPQRASHLKRLETMYNSRLMVRQLNVGQVEAIKQLGRQLADVSIDVLVNNAGVMGSRLAKFGELEPIIWLDTFRINTIAPLLLTQALVGPLAKSTLKIVANISSAMGSLSLETEGDYYYYRSSKAALNMVTKNLSIDLKSQGITVVALHPGWVRTEMGGPSAPLSGAQSVEGLRQVLHSLTISDTGTFIRYDGERLPW